MGRFGTILKVWVAGFMLGFIAYLTFPILTEIAVKMVPFLLNLDNRLVAATLWGVVSSFITTIAVVIWAYSTATSRREILY